MKRRYAMILTVALSLSLLAGCGPKGGEGSASSSKGEGSSTSQSQSGSGSTSTPDGSTPDASTPDASTPDASKPDESKPEGSTSTPGGSTSGDKSTPEPPATKGLTLNKTDFSLFSVGGSYKLKASNLPQGAKITWASSNPEVATVGEDGTVTAATKGNVTITATAGDQSATCKVYCKIEDIPASGGGSSSSSGDGSSSTPTADKVDLSAFYSTITSNYELPGFLQLADKALSDTYFAGLSDIATEQSLVYVNAFSMNTGEVVLIQVSDSADVDAVKGILQARVDSMINGGAWYPEPTRIWTDCSKVVTNGNYIFMIVNEDCDAIVKDFNALF